jgi:hypothetical protein
MLLNMKKYNPTLEQNFIEWAADAPCKGKTDLFFSIETPEIKQAIAICSTCPYVAQCKEYARVNKIEHGVWGGESRSRISNRKKRSAGEVAVHEVAQVDTDSIDTSN